MSSSPCKTKKESSWPPGGPLPKRAGARELSLQRRFRAAGVGQDDKVMVCWASRRKTKTRPSGGRNGEQCCPARSQESTSCLQGKTCCLPGKHAVWKRSEAPQNRCACCQACGILMSRQDRLPSRPDRLSSRQELFSARQDMLP